MEQVPSRLVSPRRVRPASGSSFRPDIEGLRAFAVIPVVLNHLGWWPRGGFVGVDVFFVISGFLITGLVADEIARTGRFSIKGFYLRRARRILPAALATLLAVNIAARLVFADQRVHDTVRDTWWSLGFAANIHLAREGTSYFQTYQQPSLLQHFWSLAVEEQFYVLWPLLLLLVTLWARRLGPERAGRGVLAVAAAGVLLSFLWCLHGTSSDPGAAYFSTPGRAWELGVGALVALAARQGLRTPPSLTGPLCLLGLAGIVLSAIRLDGSSTFPGPGAAWPVLATACVLMSGLGVTRFVTRWHAPVTNPVSRYIGRVSFSLYLWHWPVILVVGALVPSGAAVRTPLMITAMAGCTLLSYYAVELPFHRAGRARQSAGQHQLSRRRRGLPLPATAILALLACTLTLWALRPEAPKAPSAAQLTRVAATPVEGPEGILQRDIATALQATAWPDLAPTMSDVLGGKGAQNGLAACGVPAAVLPPANQCTWGSPTAPKVAMVVGDSTALGYMEIFRRLVEVAPDWQVRFVGMSGCEFVDVRIDNAVADVANACPARRQAAVDAVRASHPDLVFVTNSFSDQISAATNSLITVPAWTAAQERYVNLFRASTRNVVYLAPPPTDVDILQCYTAVSVPASCITHLDRGPWTTYAAAVRGLAAAQGAYYVDPTPWFCVNGLCPAFVGTVATKRDIVHVTPEYAHVIAPAVLAELRRQGLFT